MMASGILRGYEVVSGNVPRGRNDLNTHLCVRSASDPDDRAPLFARGIALSMDHEVDLLFGQRNRTVLQ
jgi:hypothetical protein